MYWGAVPGASVLVLRDGAAVLRLSLGLADVEHGVRVTPATNYRLASISKQFTSAAVLLLMEEGRLTLDESAHRWLPSLPRQSAPQGGEVTIRQMLTHTSGLIDYEEIIPAGTTAQLRYADVLTLLESEHRRYFLPGTAYRYSNTGYALLASIVERASGENFAVFLRRRLFEPLGMRQTVAFEEGVSTVAERAYGYSEAGATTVADRAYGDGASGASWTRTDQSLTSATLGDGGIYSSIDDLARWDAALYDDRLLRPESLRLACAPATATDDPMVHYGLGWRITGDSWWHSGETLGFRSVILRYPRQRVSVVVLTNRDAPDVYDTALAIAELYLPGAAAVRARAAAAGPDSGAWLMPGTMA
jgi:CubicO group peptidase (beta-lactamase class C family)